MARNSPSTTASVILLKVSMTNPTPTTMSTMLKILPVVLKGKISP